MTAAEMAQPRVVARRELFDIDRGGSDGPCTIRFR